jgi:hypothetical protein
MNPNAQQIMIALTRLRQASVFIASGSPGTAQMAIEQAIGWIERALDIQPALAELTSLRDAFAKPDEELTAALAALREPAVTP